MKMPAPTTSKRASDDSRSGNSATQDLETWVEKIIDGKDGSVPRQVFLGGVSGWVTGYLAMKVGKVAATAIGGGIILFQLANHKGYINVNWNRLNRDVDRISKQIQKEAGGRKKDWSDKVEDKLNKAADKAENLANRGKKQTRQWYHKFAYGEDLKLKELHIFTASFAIGVGLGLIVGK